MLPRSYLGENERMPVTSDVNARVTNVLVEALAVDENRVTPTASLQRDLGADSLDLLEIMFRLEQEFGIEIPRGELFPELIFRTRPAWVQDGKLTHKGLVELRSLLPYADLRGFQVDRALITVSELFTVNLVTGYIGWKLERAAGREEQACLTNSDRSENVVYTPGSCNDRPKRTGESSKSGGSPSQAAST
jgi:acyl carrier protein